MADVEDWDNEKNGFNFAVNLKFIFIFNLV